MKRNEPATQREFEFPDNATLMSTTDAQSHFTYANGIRKPEAADHAAGRSAERVPLTTS